MLLAILNIYSLVLHSFYEVFQGNFTKKFKKFTLMKCSRKFQWNYVFWGHFAKMTFVKEILLTYHSLLRIFLHGNFTKKMFSKKIWLELRLARTKMKFFEPCFFTGMIFQGNFADTTFVNEISLTWRCWRKIYRNDVF